MRHLKIQILDHEGQPSHEQTVPCPTREQLLEHVKNIHVTTQCFEAEFTIRVQAGIKTPDAQKELMLAISRSTHIYDYDELAMPVELYHLLTPVQKKMLYALAFYSTEDAAYMSGYSFHTIKDLRKKIYERTDFVCMADLTGFCFNLEKAGIKLDKDPRKD
jgi:hypothetical protein